MSTVDTFNCLKCNKSFKSIMALNGHSRMHGQSNGKSDLTNRLNENKKKLEAKIAKYNINPNKCTNCQSNLPYNKRSNKFCGHSCSAAYNNIHREKNWITDEWKRNQSVILTKNKTKTSQPIPIIEYIGDWTKVHRISCKHCDRIFYSDKRLKYCLEHRNLYKGNYLYQFKFNIYEYPNIFDLSLIDKYGWYSHGGRFDYNPYGISRDHKVSVNEAIRNGYDPYYISHLMNCELMPHFENNKKKTKSSITYSELVKLVDDFDTKYGQELRIRTENLMAPNHPL